MKKQFILWMFILSQLGFAQNRRFIYEYRFAVDSTQVDSLKTEIMYLDITQKGSEFYAESKFVRDSINAHSIIRQRKITPNHIAINNSPKPWNKTSIVKKDYPSYNISWVLRNFLVESKPRMQWNLTNEVKTIGDYACQKANLAFGGRTWEAWFSTDIPISDGPYKFYGLPGLIISLEDNTHTHRFLLKGNEKLAGKNGLAYLEKIEKEANMGYAQKRLKISTNQFKKMIREHRRDPVKNLRQSLSDPTTKVVININGREISNNQEVLRYKEKQARERMKKYNNPLELDLYR